MEKKIIVDNGESIVITLPKKGFKTAKNIILEIFIICSVCAPFSTNLWWCAACEREPALGTFFNTVYFFAAGAVFALFSDKKWNIPFMIYMFLTAVSSFAGLLFPESEFVEACNIFVLPTYWGILFATGNNALYYSVVLIFAAVMMYLMVRKYMRRKNK